MKYLVIVNRGRYIVTVDALSAGGAEHKVLDPFEGVREAQAFTLEEAGGDTFRWLATFIVIRGMIWGNILGIGLCLLQQLTGIVRLDPMTYYVAEVPIEMNWGLIVLLNIATLIITTLALVLPSFFVSTVKPARTMRME